jgi:hypothetical protein
MTTLYTEDRLQEVTSWMEDEGRSVTIATVSQSLGISRSQAQALLEQLAKRTSIRVTVVPAETILRGSSIPITGMLSKNSIAKKSFRNLHVTHLTHLRFSII